MLNERDQTKQPEQQAFAADEDIEDLIAQIRQAGVIRNDIGKEYSADQVMVPIFKLLDNINAGKYDHDSDNFLFKTDVMPITRSRGIRQAVIDTVGHIIVRRQNIHNQPK